MSVDIAWNAATTRASLTFAHPKGNILTAAIVERLQVAIDDLAQAPHLRLVTI